MAKATIISEIGNGQYSIKRNWAGRDLIAQKIDAFNAEIVTLQKKYDAINPTDQDTLFEKHVIGLQIKALEKKVEYLENNMPTDETVSAWCADYTEGLTGEIGTIDIAGEYTTDVNIRPGTEKSAAYDGQRDGELYPAIALGPWTSFLNSCIYPGWQKFKPLHRYAWIVEGTIDHEANACVISVMPTFSLMNYNVNKGATGGGENPAAQRGVKSSKIKNYNVNQGDILGQEEIELIIEGASERATSQNFFVQRAGFTHPGFLDFKERHPYHPITNIGTPAPPIYITDEQYVQLGRICRYIDYFYQYEYDHSGYKVSDYWDVMYDLGDTWYWYPSYEGEPQNEFNIGDVALTADDSGLIIGNPDYFINDYRFGAGFGAGVSWSTNIDQLELQYQISQLNMIGPKAKRRGDCEDYALTKMQAINEAGIIPLNNMQIMLCYVIGVGYHAVLGIRTSNYGYLISDQREYGNLWRIEQLARTHVWESFTTSTMAGSSAKVQVILKDVPFDYMDCNSAAFGDGDEVIVEFVNQNWDNPKIVGFKSNPVSCSAFRLLPDGSGFSYTGDEAPESEQKGTFSYYYANDVWRLAGSFPAEPTFFACCAGADGIAYRSGGYTLAPSGGYGSKPVYTDDHYMYDVNAETWQIAQSSILDRCRQRYKSIGAGKALIFGGEKSTDPKWWGDSITFPANLFYNDLKQYSFGSDTWVVKSSGARLSYPAAFVVDSILYIAAGRNTTEPYKQAGEYNDEMYSYTNYFDVWTSKQDLPARFGYACGYGFENIGYVGGGCELERYQTLTELPGAAHLHTYVWKQTWAGWVYNKVVMNSAVFCEDDEVFNYQYTTGPYECREHPDWEGEPIDDENLICGTFINGNYGGFVNTAIGIYYDPPTDSWSFGTCHPNASWAYSGFAHGEIDGGKKGIRVGGGITPTQQGFVLDSIADTWTAKRVDSGYSKGFGSSGIGVSA